MKSNGRDVTSGGYFAPESMVSRVVTEEHYEQMRQSRNQWRFNAMAALLLCTIAVAMVFMSGCAAGKTATGGVVVGFDVAALPETAGEMAGAAAEFLPEPWKSLTLAGVTLLGGGGLLGYAKKKGEAQGWDERESHQAKIDATYDLGRTEAK